MTIVLGLLIIFLSAMIQGITSFGFSLIAVPLLGMFLDLKLIVPILVLFSLFLNIIILVNLKSKPDLSTLWILIAAGIIGIPIGIQLLLYVDENVLKMVIGVLVILSAIGLFLGYKVQFKNKKIQYGIVGLLSGILNGAVSLSGPPIILMLANDGVEKDTFRVSLATVFTVLNFITFPMFYSRGLITGEVIRYSLYLSPGLLLGVWFGMFLGHKVNEAFFKKMTVVMIGLMGLTTVVSVM